MKGLRCLLGKGLPLLGGIGLLLIAASSSQADDPAVNASLLQRLERLEKQNEELRQKLDGTTPVNLEQGDAKTVQKIVSDYLKEVDNKKKADDEAKKKKAAEEGVEVGKDRDFKTVFNNGVHFATSDGAFKAALRGRWQQDWGWVTQDDGLFIGTSPGERLDDGTAFRRARLGVQGTIWEVCDFVAEFDFVESSSLINFREVWMGAHALPVISTFRAGHFKEPFSLEQMTSSRYLTFIERSINDEPFCDAYNPGMLIARGFNDDRFTLATGLFRNAPDTSPVSSLGDGNYAWTSRATVLPVWEQNGRCLVHLGAAYSYRAVERGDIILNPPAPVRTYQTRPYRVDAAPFLNIALPGNERNVFGLEAATVWGPFSAQSEFIYNNQTDVVLGGNNFGDVDFYGYYFFVSYFLTGENRVYSKDPVAGPSSPSFTRQFVYEPFFLIRRGENGCGGCCCGKGAWEVAARIGYVRLNEDAFTPAIAPSAGQLWQYTFGVNWYWNSNMKIQWNYEHLFLDRREAFAPDGFIGTALNSGSVDSFVMRFAWDF